MSLGTILLIILVIALLGGIGPWAPMGYGYGYGHGGFGVIGVLVVILLIPVLAGRI